ncbi:MAG: hypothetical protein V4736_14005 [Bdellovibrionota bacterium]
MKKTLILLSVVMGFAGCTSSSVRGPQSSGLSFGEFTVGEDRFHIIGHGMEQNQGDGVVLRQTRVVNQRNEVFIINPTYMGWGHMPLNFICSLKANGGPNVYGSACSGMAKAKMFENPKQISLKFEGASMQNYQPTGYEIESTKKNPGGWYTNDLYCGPVEVECGQ